MSAAVLELTRQPWVMRFVLTTVPPVDRWLLLRSKGRWSLSGLGVPLLLLETQGRRSGATRRTPLLCLARDHAFFVIASGGGSARHPSWWLNAQACPEVAVHYGGRCVSCVASEVTGTQRERVWANMLSLNPGFDRYQAAVERRIPLVQLKHT